MNGHCIGDEGGAFTFISPKGNSVVDYFLVSRCLFNCNISLNLTVQNEILSWLRPISMSLKFNDNNTHRDKTQATHMNTKITKIKWDPDKQHHFINDLKSPAVNQQLDDLLKELENDVNFVVRGLSSILCKNAQSMLKTVIIRHGEAHSKPTWFDKECYQYKRVVRQSLHKNSNNPNEAKKKNLCVSSTRV